MGEWAAGVMVMVVGAYVLVGVVVALWFVVWGVGRVDRVAGSASVWMRCVIVPGCVALWPMVLGWWVRVRRGGVTEGRGVSDAAE